MKRLFVVTFFVLLLIPFVCTGVQAVTDTAGGDPEYPISPNGDSWAQVLGGGVGEVVLDGKSAKCNWMAYSQREGEDIIWFLGCRLPKEYLEQIKKTVDSNVTVDTTVNQPWKATWSKDGKQTAVHTSYDWARRYCGDDVKGVCDARNILGDAIRVFRTLSFVKKWEVKEYLPKQQ